MEVGGTRMEGRLPGRLGRALLAFLVLNRHRAVTRDELMGALWPAAVPRDPAATLSTLLSGIRRALGAEVLQGRSELRLELPPDAIVDVEVAARALAEARGALPGEPTRAATSAQTALDIYESPLAAAVRRSMARGAPALAGGGPPGDARAPCRGGAGAWATPVPCAPSWRPGSWWSWPPSASPATRSSSARMLRAATTPRRSSASSGCGCCCERSWDPPRRRSCVHCTSRCSPPPTRPRPTRPRPGRARPRPRPRSSPSSRAPRSGRSSEERLRSARFATSSRRPPGAIAGSCSWRASRASARPA